MPKIILGIHGLGNKPSKEVLENWWKQAILEGLAGIGKYIFNPKFELIYWADVFNEKPLDEKTYDEKYIPAPKNFTAESKPTHKKILDFLQKQMAKIFLNEDLSINFSFVSDLFFHKYFKEVEIYYTKDCLDKNNINCAARDIIRDRVAEVLKKHEKDEILLIGHSMGSLIAYDVLMLTFPGFKIDTFVTMGSPLGMAVIIRKIAAEQNMKINKTTKLKTPPGIQRYWYNYSDPEDKVALKYKLADDYDANAKGIKATDIVVHNNYEMNGKRNPHNSFGYLRAPEFSNVLYEFLVRGKMKPTRWLLDISNNIYARLMKRHG